MIKNREIGEPNSCLNKAKDDEFVFVLLARDAAFADTVRYWARRRIELGKNKADDPQILEALMCAAAVEESK